MTSPRSSQHVWEDYQRALDDLYAGPSAADSTVRSSRKLRTEGLKGRIEPLLNRSVELRKSLEGVAQPDDVGSGELAGLKLLVAAAQDLSVAGDLLGLEETEPGDQVGRGARDTVLTPEFEGVLEAPIEGGMRRLIEGTGPSRAMLPNTPEAARKQLEKTIAVVLDRVPESAASTSRAAVAGIVNVGFGPAQAAASLAAQEMLTRLPDGASMALKAAARLVVEAAHKLQAALGKEAEAQAREKAADWFKTIQEGKMAPQLLQKLYQTARLSEEALGLVDAAPPGTTAECYNEATRRLEELLARDKKTRGVLDGLVRVLAFVKGPLLAAPPWGPVGLYAAHMGVLGYSVCSGGDYLDWYRVGETGWLDRVEGLRTIVRKAMTSEGG